MKLFNKIFKSNKTIESAALTTITRTEVLEGFSIPGIIHSMQYHFTDLQVYSDGLISCWEMVDLSMFKDKLEKIGLLRQFQTEKQFQYSTWDIGILNRETGNIQKTAYTTSYIHW